MEPSGVSRRYVLSVMAATLVLPVARGESPAAEVPQHLQTLIAEVTAGTTPTVGRVKLTLPPLAESGNSVPLKLLIESPMTAQDYVKSVHVFSARNPRPVIARFHLGPQSGKAEINTRVRLAGTQRVWALAVMSDSSAWLGSAEVVVTAAACTDENTDRDKIT
jgi:sulfur-oxidizing protein SoxY